MSFYNESPASRLLDRFSAFVCRPTRRRSTLVDVLSRFRRQPWHIHVFGGTIRDISIYGPGIVPRDIDLVASNCSIDDIAAEFEPYVQRRTRFGGLNLLVDGWKIDVWPLQDTWAFRSGVVEHCSFAKLPYTTFLNIEAVAIELDVERGYGRSLQDGGFLDSLKRRVLDLNLVENPYPLLCVARSLVMATGIRFQVGVPLARYIYEHTRQVTASDIVEVQREHYGYPRIDMIGIQRCLDLVRWHVEDDCKESLALPSLDELRSGQLWLPMT